MKHYRPFRFSKFCNSKRQVRNGRPRKLGFGPFWAARICVVLAVSLFASGLGRSVALAQNSPSRATPEVSTADAWNKAGEAYDRKDYSTAMSWYQLAADRGAPAAWFALGVMRRDGVGSKPDNAAAMKLFQAAADLGYPRAQTAIGTMYRDGQGVRQDYATAMAWYLKAAEQGEVEAQGRISGMYLGGNGVKQDFVKAMIWLQKAAEPGVGAELGAPAALVKDMNAAAQFTIGRLYEDGRGVPPDSAIAKEWYRKAAANGNAAAKEKLSDLNAPGASLDQLTFLCDMPLLNGRTQKLLLMINPSSRFVKLDTFTEGVVEYRDGALGKVIKSGFRRDDAVEVHQFVVIEPTRVKFGFRDKTTSDNMIDLRTGVLTMVGLGSSQTAVCSRR